MGHFFQHRIYRSASFVWAAVTKDKQNHLDLHSSRNKLVLEGRLCKSSRNSLCRMCTYLLCVSEYMHVLYRYFFIPEFVWVFLLKNGKAVCFDS